MADDGFISMDQKNETSWSDLLSALFERKHYPAIVDIRYRYTFT